MKLFKISLWLLAIILLLIFFSLFFTSYGKALLKSKSHFIVLEENPMILYENGTLSKAESISLYLDSAVNTIEIKQFADFEEGFKIYICASQKSMNEYIAADPDLPIRGMVLFGDVFLSPAAFDFHEKIAFRESLLHELSHLHMKQHLGFFTEQRIPVWFREGLADLVSGSCLDLISHREAADNILAGNHFYPESESGLFHTIHDKLNGLSPFMFHKQCEMFVEYLNKDKVSFQNLMISIYDGSSFEESFTKSYRKTVISEWKLFRENLQKQINP